MSTPKVPKPPAPIPPAAQESVYSKTKKEGKGSVGKNSLLSNIVYSALTEDQMNPSGNKKTLLGG